ncbi:MAG TPA: malate synthase A, partial [Microbacterium ginsengisoli]|nr:malate synthase A [Microbacterium ginsengisoli]
MTPTATGIAPTTNSTPTTHAGPAIEITGRLGERYDEILTPDAVAFLTELHHRFSGRRHDRL